MSLLEPLEQPQVALKFEEEPYTVEAGPGKVDYAEDGYTFILWLSLSCGFVQIDGQEVWFSGFDMEGTGSTPNWLQEEISNSGLDGVVLQDERWGAKDDPPLEWILRRGIAPFQPFCVRIHAEWTGPDYWTGEYDCEYDVELVSVEHWDIDPKALADMLEWAWALKERQT